MERHPLDPQPSALGPLKGLYLHVPFCAKRCSYCNFYLTTEEGPLGRFARAIEAPVAREAELFSSGPYTVALGGGTPSRLPRESLARILEGLRKRSGDAAEVSLEANPEDVTAESLAAWRDAGVTRLTLGVQTLDDGLLARLNRNHDSGVARRAVASAAAVFPNLGIDLIFGLPGQNPEAALADLAEAARWPIVHLSHYALELDPATKLGAEAARGLASPMSDDDEATLYDEALAQLGEAGFARYEVSNYAKPGFESKHNSLYWTDEDYLGIGPSAASYFGGKRWKEISDLDAWLAAAEAGRPCRVEELSPPPRELLRDAIVMGLRISAGVDLAALWRKYFPDDAPPDFATALASALETRLLMRAGGRFAVHPAKRFLTEGIAGKVVDTLGLL